MASNADGKNRLLSTAGDREVEEVEWQLSQQEFFSQTQKSQRDDVIDEDPSKALVVEERPDSQVTEGSTDIIHDEGSNPKESVSLSRSTPESRMQAGTPSPDRALKGIGNQGGRMWVDGGGELKAKTRPSQLQRPLEDTDKVNYRGADSRKEDLYFAAPVTVMALEVHVQCRMGRAGVSDSKQIAMTPDSDRDKVFAVAYVYGRDPGGGESLQILERGCIFVPVERELSAAQSDEGITATLDRLSGSVRTSMPPETMGIESPFSVGCVKDEKQLLLRLASIVYSKDPDMLLSWDTQGGGLGYLIERGAALGKTNSNENDKSKASNGKGTIGLDMARLLGRTRRSSTREKAAMGARSFLIDEDVQDMDVGSPAPRKKSDAKASDRWKGSGLGSEWDDRVGAGAAAASIVSVVRTFGFKLLPMVLTLLLL